MTQAYRGFLVKRVSPVPRPGMVRKVNLDSLVCLVRRAQEASTVSDVTLTCTCCIMLLTAAVYSYTLANTMVCTKHAYSTCYVLSRQHNYMPLLFAVSIFSISKVTQFRIATAMYMYFLLVVRLTWRKGRRGTTGASRRGLARSCWIAR